MDPPGAAPLDRLFVSYMLHHGGWAAVRALIEARAAYVASLPSSERANLEDILEGHYAFQYAPSHLRSDGVWGLRDNEHTRDLTAVLSDSRAPRIPLPLVLWRGVPPGSPQARELHEAAAGGKYLTLPDATPASLDPWVAISYCNFSTPCTLMEIRVPPGTPMIPVDVDAMRTHGALEGPEADPRTATPETVAHVTQALLNLQHEDSMEKAGVAFGNLSEVVLPPAHYHILTGEAYTTTEGVTVVPADLVRPADLWGVRAPSDAGASAYQYLLRARPGRPAGLATPNGLVGAHMRTLADILARDEADLALLRALHG